MLFSVVFPIVTFQFETNTAKKSKKSILVIEGYCYKYNHKVRVYTGKRRKLRNRKQPIY